jgi:hypothetical protein
MLGKPTVPPIVTRAVRRRLDMRGWRHRPTARDIKPSTLKRYVPLSPYYWTWASPLVRRSYKPAVEPPQPRRLKARPPKKRSKPWSYNRGRDRQELSQYLQDYYDGY